MPVSGIEQKFSIAVNRAQNIVDAKAFGYFLNEDGVAFVDAYRKAVKTINPGEYTLDFDCTGLKVAGKDINSGTDMADVLRGCIEMYKNDGFKLVVFKCGTNALVKGQLKRLIAETGCANARVE